MAIPSEKIIGNFFERGILLNAELIEKGIEEGILEKITSEEDLLVLNQDYTTLVSSGSFVDWYDVDKYRTDAERDRNEELYQHQLQRIQKSTLSFQTISPPPSQELTPLETQLLGTSTNFTTILDSDFPSPDESLIVFTPTPPTHPYNSPSSVVTIVLSYINIPHKYTVQDFSNFFISRYKFLESILRSRQELERVTNISRILSKKEKEEVAVIGVVEEIGETKNGNIALTLEDPTGKIKIIISQKNKDLFHAAKDLVVDEVIGITGTNHENIIFVEKIIWPDIPLTHPLKKGPLDEYVLFLSDIHVGSKQFLKEEFSKFLRWLNCEGGSITQKEIASKVKYIFIAGDLVDGIGIYPSQEDELEIKDIMDQYREFASLIKQIPSDKKIIMCPGNHDAVHLAEPQPAFYSEFSPDLFNIPNVTLVTNPSIVNIGKTDSFEGFDILLYHGYSFDYYVANVESIRNGGGYHRSDLIMTFLLKRRHLAPSFSSTPYYPSHSEDPLLIRKIPDFFVTGHIHYCNVANYRGVTMMSGSCWQGKTSFQEKLGHDPEPARVLLVNLKTREVKIMRFG